MWGGDRHLVKKGEQTFHKTSHGKEYWYLIVSVVLIEQSKDFNKSVYSHFLLS